MKLAALLDPRCPTHPENRVEDHGVCATCLMSSHRHLSGFRLITAPAKRVVYRSEGEEYYDTPGVTGDE